MQDTLDERRRFAGLLTALSDYYKSEISKAVAGIYWAGLKQYDFEAIEKACWTHTQSPDEAGRWMPRNSDIIKIIEGNTVDQASVAWSKVDAAVKQVGTWRDVAFDDAIIHRVIADMGGWIWFGYQGEKEWPFIAKNFEVRYRGYRISGETPQYQPILIGISNAQNSMQGFSIQPPVMIGEEIKAQKVIAGGSTTPLLNMGLAKAKILINNQKGKSNE